MLHYNAVVIQVSSVCIVYNGSYICFIYKIRILYISCSCICDVAYVFVEVLVYSLVMCDCSV
jgi:hypothetical protein